MRFGFVITTKRLDACTCFVAGADWPHATGCPGVSRRAVATLEDARRAVWDALQVENGAPPIHDEATFLRLELKAEHLSERGGSVGPLPDGTVIEVESRPLSVLWDEAFPPFPRRKLLARCSTAEIVAAWNERHGDVAREAA